MTEEAHLLLGVGGWAIHCFLMGLLHHLVLLGLVYSVCTGNRLYSKHIYCIYDQDGNWFIENAHQTNSIITLLWKTKTPIWFL